MYRSSTFALIILLLVAGVGCSGTTDAPSGDSDDPAGPALGQGKQDSTTRDTNIEGSIAFGEEIEGQYRDEYVGYTFELSGDATITARVESEHSDPAVWLYGPKENDGDWGWEIAENDDIDYDNDNAEISGESIEEPGTYLVVTGTEEWGESRGDYTLRVECSGGGCSGTTDGGTNDGGSTTDADVCGAEIDEGDFVSTDDRSVDGFAVGDGLVYAGIDDWNGTIESDDDKAIICAYPIEDDVDFGYDEFCFEPRQVETTTGIEPIEAVAYESSKLYVAIGPTLFVYDVSSLESPRLLGEWSTDANTGLVALDIEVRDGIVFLGGSPRILDASDPANIRLLHHFDDQFFRDWTVADGTVYAASETSIRSYDVSDPSNPSQLDTFRPQSEPIKFGDVAYDDGHLYAVSDPDSADDNRSGLWVFEASDSGDLENIHRSEGSPKEGLDIVVRGGFAVVAKRVAVDYGEYENRVQVFDVSTPSSPRPVEELRPEGIPRDMTFHGANVFYASFDWGNTFSTDRNGVGSLETACGGY